MDSEAIEGHIEDQVVQMISFDQRAKDQAAQEKNNTKMASVWRAACSLMSELDLNVVVMKGKGTDPLMSLFEVGEATNGSVRAAHFKDNKYILVNADEVEDPPAWGSVLNLLHEAAHLLTGQFENFDESEGVCQVELVLARMISKETYDKLVLSHENDYGWVTDYKTERRGRKWKEGAKRARFILSKFDIIKIQRRCLRVVW